MTLEPNTDSGRADVLVEKPADSFLIEAKGFDLDQTTDAQMKNSDRLSSAVQTIERIKKVSVTGDIAAASAEEVGEWEDQVADAADQALERVEPVSVEGPTGVLTVYPTPLMNGHQFSIEFRHGEEWERVLDAVSIKAEQARSGDVPVWLRFDESTHFWALQIPGHPLERAKCLADMAASLNNAVRRHPHLAGVVLSSTPLSGGSISQEWWTTREHSVYLALTTNPPYFRETLIVPGAYDRAHGYCDAWRSWYRGEPSWLEWALSAQGLPDLDEIFTGDDADPFLAARRNFG